MGLTSAGAQSDVAAVARERTERLAAVPVQESYRGPGIFCGPTVTPLHQCRHDGEQAHRPLAVKPVLVPARPRSSWYRAFEQSLCHKCFQSRGEQFRAHPSAAWKSFEAPQP